MINNLSVVNIIPERFVGVLNTFAEACGCGPNNLNRKLKDSNDNLYFGCHSYWKPSDYSLFTNLETRDSLLNLIENEENREEVREALLYLYERSVLDEKTPLSNWNLALSELGLIEIK